MERNVQSGRAGYRPDIDGLRALAVCAVIVFHAFPDVAPGGFVGVDVFFMVSGFLISRLLWGALEDGSFDLRTFYARRIRRIFPALALALAVCLSLGWFTLLPPEYARLGKHVVGGAAFVSNFVLWGEAGYFDRAAELKPLLHLWSLAIEEQFYIVWPLLLVAVRRMRLPLVTIALAVFVVSFTISVRAASANDGGAFYSPATRVWELALGAAMARAPRVAVSVAVRHLASIAGVLVVCGSVFVLSRLDPFPGWAAALPTFGTCLVLAAGPEAWLNRRVLASRAFVFVGLISYPLYLWHWPFLSFARILSLETPPLGIRVAAIALATVAAWATYWCVERPIRSGRGGRRVVAGLAAAAAVLAALGVVVHRGHGIPSRIAAPLRQYVSSECDLTAGVDRACWLSGEASEYPETCLGGREPGITVLLWGDSHAARLSAGMKNVVGDRAHFAQLTHNSCPPIVDYGNGGCLASNANALRAIRELKPAVVVLFANWVQHGRAWTNDDSVGRLFAETLRDVAAASGGRIFVIGPAPQWRDDLPRALATATFRDVPAHRVPRRMTFGLDPVVPEVDAALEAFVTGMPAVTYVSPSRLLCDPEGCLTRVDDEPDGLMTCDYGHLTTKGAVHLARAIAAKNRGIVPGPRL